MDLDKQVVQEVIDLFDIKYTEQDDETDKKEGMPSSFSDVADDLSSVMTDMDFKGKALEEEPKEEVVEETGETENDLESIEDLIADSVEEAKALTSKQEIQAEEALREEEFKFEEELDSIELSEEVQEQLEKSCPNPELEISSSHPIDTDDEVEVKVDTEVLGVYPETGNPSFDNMSQRIAVEISKVLPTSIQEEEIEIIPRKDSEGNVKGEVRMVDVVDTYIDTKGKTVVQGGIILWDTESPSELYDEFYAIKRDHIDKFSGGKQLNFARLYQELYDAKVDTSTEVLDQRILIRKMDEVMNCIERVAMIQVQINQQHWVWKRFAELLRGALARVQYLKPVLKQDGLILEHMGDVEFYSDRVTAIKNSAHDVMGTLEKAFESISRKVTIMLSLQSKHTVRMSPDSYDNSHQSHSYQEPVVEEEHVEKVPAVPTCPIEPVVPAQDLSDYDGFDIGTKVVAGKPKSGQVA